MTADLRVLVVDGNARHRRWVAQILRTVVATPDVQERLPEGPLDRGYDLVIASWDPLAPAERLQLLESAAPGRPGALILLSESLPPADLIDLLTRRVLTNLLAVDGAVDANDLLVTVQKILRRDIFGLDKYFAWGVEPLVLKLGGSAEKGGVVEAAHEFATPICQHPRFVSLYCTVVDELTTNALYDAPVDAEGRPRFATRPRAEDVRLDRGEEIEVRLCSDGKRLGVSVSDPFGSLRAETVAEGLARCLRKGDDQIDQKPGGAGLGLYNVLADLSHLAINISSGRRTEMIGLLDIRSSYRDFASRGKSLNIFQV